ncbi:MAG TPA: DegT/DnrJ/EryC1/StrS family aminotransferase [Thermoanaerobaculia bacterium]|nr:DegT/DnrJ/EryC1/StrS family aminotransferase [Thermoanaerobaculia bacterium]
MIRLFQPTLGEDELAAIAGVFADQWPGTGPRVRQFEEAFASYIGAPPEQMIAVTSCTEGLFQAMAALELDAASEVLLPTVSFIGAAHAVHATGARIRLVDVDPVTLNPRLEHIADALTPHTRAILVLHYGGQLPEISAIAELARAVGVTLVEDTACGLGGGQGAAYGTLGDVGVWSFDAMKLLVTGDGGMLRISDANLRRKIYDQVSLGGVVPGHEVAGGAVEWWRVNPSCAGRKARMNDLAAAIGLAQLAKLDVFVERRREIGQTYDSALRGLPWIGLPPPQKGVPYFYWIRTAPPIRDRLAAYLREHGVYTTFRYWPLHRTKLYADGQSYPGADQAADSTLLLPVHQNLSTADVARVIDLMLGFRC